METLPSPNNIDDQANDLPAEWQPVGAEDLAASADAEARSQLGMSEITPLTETHGLYVNIEWADPSQDITMKTTYSTQSEAGAD